MLRSSKTNIFFILGILLTIGLLLLLFLLFIKFSIRIDIDIYTDNLNLFLHKQKKGEKKKDDVIPKNKNSEF